MDTGATEHILVIAGNHREEVDLTNERPTWVRWRILALLCLFVGLGHFNRISMSVAGPEIQKTYHVSDTEMGAIFSAFLASYTLCMTPGGWIIDRFGPKAALAGLGVGSALFVSLTSLGGIGTTTVGGAILSFQAIRVLAGGFNAPLHPATSRMIHQWFPATQRSLANGLATAAAPLGIALTYVLFSRLIGVVGWEWAFVVNGTLTLSLAIVWLLYAKNDPSQHAGVNTREWRTIVGLSVSSVRAPRGEAMVAMKTSWREFFRNRSLFLITASYVSIGYFQYLLFYWIEKYFRDVAMFTPSQSQNYSTIATLSMVVTMPLGGLVSDRLSMRMGRGLARKTVVMSGMSAASLFLVLATLSTSALPMVAFFTLALGSLGLVEGPFWTTAVDLGGRLGGTSAAIFNTGGNIGGIVAPVLSPWLGENYGWQWSMGLGSLICFAGVIFWIWIAPPENEPDTRGIPVADGRD